ncbi:hypothetical protein BDC45DRAFT_507609 [Circinella umbellata]|nr:hypothetical protein BDC45DRAFT_507609 [Circinella umbellata]
MNQSSIVHNGFLEKLSYDIISNIFLYLDQQDCLNCMAVCRQWFELIPHFTEDKWETLRLDGNGINHYQKLNLGKHVKHVFFDGVPEDLLSNMMQKLLDSECTEIEFLEFTRCVSASTEKQQHVFLNLLHRLASSRLTRLTMKDHDLKFAILDLIFVCPHLTHFSYTVTVGFTSRDYNDKPIQLLSSDQISYNSLIYLHADTVTPIIQDQIQSIISRSPNLRYFIGAHKHVCKPNPKTLILPKLILTKCPKLEYYVGDGSYEQGEKFIRDAFLQSLALLSTTSIATNSNNNNSSNRDRDNDRQQSLFQYFSVFVHSNIIEICFVLRKYKDILKHLKIIGTRSEFRKGPDLWTYTFQNYSMQYLRTLHCENINYSMESIVTLLNTCCNTIVEVQLQHRTRAHELDVATIQSLETLPQLRTLAIKPVTFEDDSSVVALLIRAPALENLILKQKKSVTLPEEAAPLLKNLRHLSLSKTYNPSQDGTRFAGPLLSSPDFFISLAQSVSKIESVTLKGGKDIDIGKGISIPFTILHALATLPSLKSLDVGGVQRYFNGEINKEKEEQHMLQFLNNFLRGCDDNTNSNKTTVASSSTEIENLTLYDVSKLTYNMLNILCNFNSLQNLSVFFATDCDWDNSESPTPSYTTCMNVDLYGVLDLLRKCRKLKRVVFTRVKSYGEHPPSVYFEEKLVEQQQNNLQLRKYIVNPGRYFDSGKNNIKLESTVEIINTRY